MKLMKLRLKDGTIVSIPFGRGKDGHTPRKGIDYCTPKEETELIDKIWANIGVTYGEGLSSVIQKQGGAKSFEGILDALILDDGEVTEMSVAKGINDSLFGSCHQAFGDNNFAAGRKNRTYQNSSVALGSGCIAGNEALQNEYDTLYKGVINQIHMDNPQGKDESDEAYYEKIISLIEQETGKSSGNLSFIYYSGSVATGVSSQATGRASTALGLGCKTTGDYAHTEGEQTEAKRAWGHAEGYKTQAEGQASHAEGYMVISRGDKSHAEGCQTQALELQSHSEGRETIAAGRSSHAEGYTTQANGVAAHSEGCGTIANGDYSHTEGNRSQTEGSYSHAEGSGTLSSGNCAHSEGLSSRAKGEASHAEGVDTEAGYGAHAEGYGSVASGSYAHAEGHKTTAEWGAHAEGNQTKALSSASHSEGYLTTASGQYSHAEGHKTEAVGNAQHVQGKYNIIDVVIDESGNSNYAHIVGNGTATKRSNAYTLDWEGNAWFAGSIQAVNGIMLVSPGKKLFKLVVSDDGTLSTQEVN